MLRKFNDGLKNQRNIYLFITILSIVLLLIYPSLEQFFFALSVSLLATTIPYLLTIFLYRDSTEIYEEKIGNAVAKITDKLETTCYRLQRIDGGLIRIHLDKPDYLYTFETASSIDILVNTGAALFSKPTPAKLSKAIENGCRVRILFPDDKSKIWEIKNNGLGDNSPTSIKSTIAVLVHLANVELPKKRNLGSIYLRRYPSIPTCSMVIVDDMMRFQPYSAYSDIDPAYDISSNEGKLYTIYKEAFEKIWAESKDKEEIAIDYSTYEPKMPRVIRSNVKEVSK